MLPFVHPGHGHCIAKGAGLRAVMAEIFAKSTGCSMHIADFGVEILGTNGIVAAGIPIAVGAGLSCQIEGKGRITVAFFGDGAVNFAASWRLPVVFVCENNVYGFSTYYRRTMALENIADRDGGP